MKKIAHVSVIFNFSNMTGVVQKVHDMAACVPDCDFYIFNFVKSSDEGNVKYRLLGGGSFINKFSKYSQVSREVNFSYYSMVILRYVGADVSLVNLVKENPNKIVLEHHTKEIEELRTRDLNVAFKYGQIFNEKFFLNKTTDYILGVVGVTADILDYQIVRHNPKVVSNTLLPNGVNHLRFKPLSNNFKKSELKLVVVAGIYADWHALDRLLKSLRVYSGKHKIILDIIGDATLHEKLIQEVNNCHVQVKYHGRLARTEMEKIISGASIAVDSLGLHRIDFSDSSTLKSRDYILNGMPMIRSCPDNSLEDISNYIYYAKHDDSCIDFQDVIQWYTNLDSRNIGRAYRQIIFEQLSWSVVFEGLKTKFLMK